MRELPTLDEAADLLSPLLGRAATAGVFLDVDGVLAPIMPRPEQTFVSPEKRELVRGLGEVFALVAVVSGRAATNAGELVGLPEVLVVGNHGMESLDAGAHAWLVPDEILARVAAAREQLAGDDRLRELGVRLEDKTASVALHTRGVPDERRAWETALETAQEVAQARGLVMLAGRRVIDLRPPGINKGTAVRELIERHRLDGAVYVGDDRTDIDAFRTLHALAAEGDFVAVNAAVASDESPEDLFEFADLAVPFEDVSSLLALLAGGGRAAS